MTSCVAIAQLRPARKIFKHTISAGAGPEKAGVGWEIDSERRPARG